MEQKQQADNVNGGGETAAPEQSYQQQQSNQNRGPPPQYQQPKQGVNAQDVQLELPFEGKCEPAVHGAPLLL